MLFVFFLSPLMRMLGANYTASIAVFGISEFGSVPGSSIMKPFSGQGGILSKGACLLGEMIFFRLLTC